MMQAQKSVLLVGNFLSAFTGNRFVCEELAARLEATGWRVLTTSDKLGRFQRIGDMVSTIWRKRHSYAVSQVDVFSGPSFIWAEAACWTLRRAGKPYVLALRGGNLPAFAARWPWRVRHLFNSAAVVTTPSRYLLEQLADYHADLRLLPNPLELKDYPFRLRDEPRPNLVWLRTFHNVYNPALAPRVVAALAADFPDIHLTMVGPDRKDGSLDKTHAVAAELGVTERITFHGSVPKAEVPAHMSPGDIFLNTTNFDNTPVTVMEAMACGLCVVSTRVGGVPYLVDHEHDGLLVPPDDAEAMAAAVRRILTEPGLAGRLSQNARAKGETFDWSTVLRQWETVLTGMIEESNP
jgi:glycosyltransferase involved in cell wall biosynthesis